MSHLHKDEDKFNDHNSENDESDEDSNSIWQNQWYEQIVSVFIEMMREIFTMKINSYVTKR